MPDLQAGIPEWVKNGTHCFFGSETLVKQEQVEIGEQTQFLPPEPTHCDDRNFRVRHG